jgi:hypothetical protein
MKFPFDIFCDLLSWSLMFSGHFHAAVDSYWYIDTLTLGVEVIRDRTHLSGVKIMSLSQRP